VAAAEAANRDRPLWFAEAPEDRPTLRTQKHWIRRAIGLLGLAPELAVRKADQAAEVLGVAVGDHRASRREVAAARDIRDRAAGVVHVLSQVDVDDGVFARLIGSGLHAGVWLEAGIWDGQRRRLVFPNAGMRPRPIGAEAIGPPPKSPSRPASRSP
jgi:hypothetical protein